MKSSTTTTTTTTATTQSNMEIHHFWFEEQQLGLTVRPSIIGVQVSEVTTNGEAERLGIKVDDYILFVNKEQIQSPKEFSVMAARVRPLSVTLKRKLTSRREAAATDQGEGIPGENDKVTRPS